MNNLPNLPINGGWNAQQIELDDIPVVRNVSILPGHIEGAKQDLRMLKKGFKNGHYRKAIPDWSAPFELWKLIFLPLYVHKPKQTGIGFQPPQIDLYVLHNRLIMFLASVRAVMQFPLLWNRSLGHGIDKANSKEGFDAIRYIHIMDPVGKNYVKMGWRKFHGELDFSDLQYGGVPMRRREEAVLIQLCFAWRLAFLGFTTALILYDGKNAFCSPSHEYMDTLFNVQHFFACLIVARYKCMLVSIAIMQGLIHLLACAGVLQGDSHATRLFAKAYDPLVEQWDNADQ